MDNVACFVQTTGNRGNLLATKAVASRFSPTSFPTDRFFGGEGQPFTNWLRNTGYSLWLVAGDCQAVTDSLIHLTLHSHMSKVTD